MEESPKISISLAKCDLDSNNEKETSSKKAPVRPRFGCRGRSGRGGRRGSGRGGRGRGTRFRKNSPNRKGAGGRGTRNRGGRGRRSGKSLKVMKDPSLTRRVSDPGIKSGSLKDRIQKLQNRFQKKFEANREEIDLGDVVSNRLGSFRKKLAEFARREQNLDEQVETAQSNLKAAVAELGKLKAQANLVGVNRDEIQKKIKKQQLLLREGMKKKRKAEQDLNELSKMVNDLEVEISSTVESMGDEENLEPDEEAMLQMCGYDAVEYEVEKKKILEQIREKNAQLQRVVEFRETKLEEVLEKEKQLGEAIKDYDDLIKKSQKQVEVLEEIEEKEIYLEGLQKDLEELKKEKSSQLKRRAEWEKKRKKAQEARKGFDEEKNGMLSDIEEVGFYFDIKDGEFKRKIDEFKKKFRSNSFEESLPSSSDLQKFHDLDRSVWGHLEKDLREIQGVVDECNTEFDELSKFKAAKVRFDIKDLKTTLPKVEQSKGFSNECLETYKRVMEEEKKKLDRIANLEAKFSLINQRKNDFHVGVQKVEETILKRGEVDRVRNKYLNLKEKLARLNERQISDLIVDFVGQLEEERKKSRAQIDKIEQKYLDKLLKELDCLTNLFCELEKTIETYEEYLEKMSFGVKCLELQGKCVVEVNVEMGIADLKLLSEKFGELEEEYDTLKENVEQAKKKCDEITSSFESVQSKINIIQTSAKTKEKEEIAGKLQHKQDKDRLLRVMSGEDDEVKPTNPESMGNMMEALSKDEYIEFVKKIDMTSCCQLDEKGKEGLKKFLENPKNMLEQLNLSKCSLNDSSFIPLADAILLNDSIHLKKIDLGHNSLQLESMIYLGKIIRKNKTLISINLERNWSLSGNGKSFSYLLKNLILNTETKLETLNLTYTGTYDFTHEEESEYASVDLLGESNNTLTSLNLWGSQIKPGSFFSDVISKMHSLSSLCLAYTSTTDDTVKPLLEGVVTLEKLSSVNLHSDKRYMNNNTFGAVGAKHLKNIVLETKSKFSVDISGNEIGNEGLEELVNISDRLGIQFDEMNLSDEGIPALKKFLDKKGVGSSLSLPMKRNHFKNENGVLTNFFENYRDNITTFDISYSLIRNQGAESLISFFTNNEKILNLGLHQIGVDGSISPKFWDAIFGMKNLSELRIGGNELGDTGMKNLTNGMKTSYENGSCKCCKLNVSSVALTSISMGYLVNLSKVEYKPQSFYLFMNDCGLTDNLLIPFFTELYEFNPDDYLYLHLKNNKFGVPSLKELMKSLKKRPTLTRIYIKLEVGNLFDNCNIDQGSYFDVSLIDEELVNSCNEESMGRVTLPEIFEKKLRSEILKNKTFQISSQSLKMSNKGITAVELPTLLKKVLENDPEGVKNLTAFDISKNSFGDAGVEHLCEFLGKATELESLDISECGLTDSGMVKVLLVLEVCNKVRSVSFKGNFIGEESMEIMRKLKLL